MITRRLSAAGLFLVMVAAASGAVAHPSAQRAGQIVFAQAGEVGNATAAPVGSITLAECVETPDGLRVTGRAGGRSELVLVLVTGGQVAGPGRAIGAGYAENSQLVADAGPGEFTITLPWATLASDFAVVEADLLLEQRQAMRIDGPVRCPSAKAQG